MTQMKLPPRIMLRGGSLLLVGVQQSGHGIDPSHQIRSQSGGVCIRTSERIPIPGCFEDRLLKIIVDQSAAAALNCTDKRVGITGDEYNYGLMGECVGPADSSRSDIGCCINLAVSSRDCGFNFYIILVKIRM